jgi:hypothetical protein
LPGENLTRVEAQERAALIGVEAIVISTNGPAELEVVELMLDAFSRAGLSDDEVNDLGRLLGQLVENATA